MLKEVVEITQIERLRDVGVFRDYTWSSEPGLVDFGRFNLIYGWNGSGKTTLSRVLRNLELGNAPPVGDIVLKTAGRKIAGDEFGDLPAESISLKVFNRDFIRGNVFRPDDDVMTPIVVLGKRSIEAQQKIEQLTTELASLNGVIESHQEEERDLQRRLNDHSQESARNLKNVIGNHSESNYRNYHRGQYQSRADAMIEAGDVEASRLSDDRRDALIQRQADRLRSPVELPTFADVDLTGLAADATELLIKTVSATALDSLARDATLAEWVRHGMEIHDQRLADECLYCSRPMPPNRLEALKAHFDSAHGELMRGLDAEIAKCEAGAKAYEAIDSNLPVVDQLFSDLAAPFQEARSQLITEAKRASVFLQVLADDLRTKKERAFEAVSPGYEPPMAGREAFASLTRLVEKHNKGCAEFQDSVERARKSLEADFIAGRLNEYETLTSGLERVKLTQEQAGARAKEIGGEIARLEAEVLDHRPPADDLNTDLRNYLGQGAMQLEVREHGYTLMRDGRPAKDPSEGEITAIALLYFLRSLDSRGFDLQRGVVVLDDPVSSLDENALFTAASYIRRRTERAGQLFILTHNFAFFREMRNWLKHVNDPREKSPWKQPARFYMLQCYIRDGQRASKLQQLDPLLEEYESDYHYLFSQIYRAANAPNESLKENYVLPNMARRLLEAFLAFRHPQSDSLWKKANGLNFDAVKTTQILRFLNVYSHDETVGAPQHDPTLLAESGPVLANLLELIQQVDCVHYNAMIALIEQER